MSEDSKECAENAREYLGDASENLRRASELLKQAGDKKAAEQISEIKKTVETVKTDINKKLNG